MSLKEDLIDVKVTLENVFGNKEGFEKNLLSDPDISNLSDEEYDKLLEHFVALEDHAIRMIRFINFTLNSFERKIEANILPRMEFSLQAMAHLAEKFDKSNDPELKRQASVLDTCLELFSNNLEKEAAEENLRAKYRQREIDNAYKLPAETLGKINKTTETAKKISEELKKAKEYRPMQHSLSTRYCPDHPGVQTIALGDNQYQCSMDKKVYDYRNGYQTMNGDKVPGGGVEQQSKMMLENQNHVQNFDTREGRQSK